MVSIETEDGEIIRIHDKHLRAAQVKRIWCDSEKTLKIVLTWQDTGNIGDPMLMMVDGVVEIRTRTRAAVAEVPGKVPSYMRSLADL